MASYTFNSEALYNAVTDQVVENASGGKLVSTFGGPALPIYDLNDNPIPEITSNASGQTIMFKADAYRGLVQFGSVAVGVVALEVADMAVAAQGAIAVANAAAAAAAQAQDDLAAYIATAGGGLPAGTTLDQIQNGIDRLAMTGAERSKIASTPTTFLQLGGTATTAMRGDFMPTAAQIGAIRNVSGVARIWGRSVALGETFPTVAEGAAEGDWLFLDES